MRKIILFPASGKIAQNNYNRLVKNGVYVPGDAENKKRRIWGTTNGEYGYNLSKIKLIQEGDIALFVCQKKIISCALLSPIPGSVINSSLFALEIEILSVFSETSQASFFISGHLHV